MNPIAPTYLSQTEESGNKLSPAQEAEQRRRQQRVKGMHKPGVNTVDPVDAAAALKLRMGKSARSKSATLLTELTSLAGEVAGDTGIEEQQRLLAGADAQAKKLALEQSALLHGGVLPASPQETAIRVLPSGGHPSLLGLLDDQFDQLYRAGNRLLAGGANAHSIEETLALLQQMGPAARQLPLSAYEQDNAATHAARIDSGFDFLQGYFSEMHLPQAQEVSVEQAILLARNAVQQAAQQAHAQRQQKLAETHATLELAGKGAVVVSKTDSGLGTGGPEQAAAIGSAREKDSATAHTPATTADADDKRLADLERARDKLHRYQQGVEQLSAQLPLVPPGADMAALQRSMQGLRALTPEISLLRLERGGGQAEDLCATLKNSLSLLAKACEDLQQAMPGKQELARAIFLERQRLAQFDDRSHKSGETVLSQHRHARELQEDRNKQNTVLKINTGSGS